MKPTSRASKLRYVAAATVVLILSIEPAFASWFSKITGIDINVPAGTISFSSPRPDAIPDMLRNLPTDILEALNPAGLKLAFMIREAQKQAQNGAQPIPPNIRALLKPFFPEYILDKARWNVYDPNRWTLDSLVLSTDCTDLHLPFNIDCKIGAITLDQTIVFRGRADVDSNVGTWAHELVHVSQYDSMGVDGFAFVYASPGLYSLEKQAYDWSATVVDAINRRIYQTLWTVAPGPRVPLTMNDFKRAVATVSSNPLWRRSHSGWGHGEDCSILGPGTDTGISIQEAANHYAQGQNYERASKWSNAVAEYREAVRLNHIDASAFDRLGVALTRIGQTDEGIMQIKKAVCMDRSQDAFKTDLALALQAGGNWSQAIVEYQVALSLNPNAYSIRRELAAAFRKQGDEDDASIQDWAASQLSPADGGPRYTPLRNSLTADWSMAFSQTTADGPYHISWTLLRLDGCVLSWNQETSSSQNRAVNTFGATVMLGQIKPQNISASNVVPTGWGLTFKDPEKLAITTLQAVQTASGWRPPAHPTKSLLAGFEGLHSADEANRVLTMVRQIVSACNAE